MACKRECITRIKSCHRTIKTLGVRIRVDFLIKKSLLFNWFCFLLCSFIHINGKFMREKNLTGWLRAKIIFWDISSWNFYCISCFYCTYIWLSSVVLPLQEIMYGNFNWLLQESNLQINLRYFIKPFLEQLNPIV